jgi:UPF0271 protein
MQIVSSANIAFGGHSGDADTMRKAIDLAKANGVVIGAHPGFADKENFGRKRLKLPPEKLKWQVSSQVQALKRLTDEAQVSIKHVKLHGALANIAAEDEYIAVMCLRTVREILDDVAVLAIDNSAQVEAANRLGMRVIREAYADRAYTAEGLLVPRSQDGAVLTDPDAVVAQCLRLAEKGEIAAIDGTIIATKAQSLCIHGDTPDAVTMARKIREQLESAGIGIKSPL